jgi:hypothetical protein
MQAALDGKAQPLVKELGRSRGSCVAAKMRRLMSWMHTDASSSKAPIVLFATVTKLYMVDTAAYFVCLWRSASAASVPDAITGWLRWLGARVSGHVKSQTRKRPYFHGTVVRPSGRFPSSR